MNNPVVLAVLITLALGLLLYALFVPRSETEVHTTGADGAERSTWLKVLGFTSSEIIRMLPESLADKVHTKPKSEVESLIQKSGNPWNLRASEFKSVQLVYSFIFMCVLSGLGLLLIKSGIFDMLPLWLWAIVGALVGYTWPKSTYKTAVTKRDIDFKRQLPDALDLLIISLSAGITFPTALREALPNMRSGVLRDEFTDVSRRLDTGRTLHESLDSFADRAPSDSITAFVRAVQEATALNVPLIEVMQQRADASRQEYFAMLQQKTASLESRMMAILTPTLVPALLVTVMAPAISQLSSMM